MPRPLPLFLALARDQAGADPARLARVLAGVRRYQDAPRTPRPAPPPAIATAGRAVLRDYGGSGPPVVFVPSLINPPDVLDLSPDRSLLRWLAQQGHRVLMVDWGSPRPEDAGVDLAAHVSDVVVPLLRAAGDGAAVVGYCLGGTMALGLAAVAPVRALALIAAPWRFAGFPDPARGTIASIWGQASAISERLGYLPMEVLQSAFWQLDPARTVDKFETFAALDAGSPRFSEFVTLEDWANAGPPLPHAAARDVAEQLFGRDATGRGEWMVGATRVDPAALTCPVLDIVSARDRIVPADSAVGLGDRRLLDLGHVGMVVGSRATEALWNPLASWLSTSTPKQKRRPRRPKGA